MPPKTHTRRFGGAGIYTTKTLNIFIELELNGVKRLLNGYKGQVRIKQPVGEFWPQIYADKSRLRGFEKRL